jgi:hypothetical protein
MIIQSRGLKILGNIGAAFSFEDHLFDLQQKYTESLRIAELLMEF